MIMMMMRIIIPFYYRYYFYHCYYYYSSYYYYFYYYYYYCDYYYYYVSFFLCFDFCFKQPIRKMNPYWSIVMWGLLHRMEYNMIYIYRYHVYNYWGVTFCRHGWLFLNRMCPCTKATFNMFLFFQWGTHMKVWLIWLFAGLYPPVN